MEGWRVGVLTGFGGEGLANAWVAVEEEDDALAYRSCQPPVTLTGLRSGTLTLPFDDVIELLLMHDLALNKGKDQILVPSR